MGPCLIGRIGPRSTARHGTARLLDDMQDRHGLEDCCKKTAARLEDCCTARHPCLLLHVVQGMATARQDCKPWAMGTGPLQDMGLVDMGLPSRRSLHVICWKSNLGTP